MIRRVCSRISGSTRATRRPRACSSNATGGRVLGGVFDGGRDRGAPRRDRRRSSRRCRPSGCASDKEEFRYELLNRSAACQAAVASPADPRGDRTAARRGLPCDRQHGVAQSGRVQGRPVALRRRAAHPARRGRPLGRSHPVPRVRDRRPHLPPGLHASPTGRLRSCPEATVQVGSRRSTRCSMPTLTYDGRPPVVIEADGGRRRAVRLRRVAPRAAGAPKVAGAATSCRCTTAAATSRSGCARPTR